MMLPNFLLIGANKAGTTSFHSYLNQHPEIYMSPIKEPMFFVLEGERKNDCSNIMMKDAIYNLKDYQALFKNVTTQKAIGESSTAYLCNGKAPYLIKKYIPNAKLIAILRNPVERAYSNYLWHLRVGMETATDFSSALENKPHYRRRGYYYDNLQRYFDFFDCSQIKIYLYDDWNTNPEQIMKNCFEFLEVDNSFMPDMTRRHHDSITIKNKLLYSFIEKLRQVTKFGQPFIPKFVDYYLFRASKNINFVKPPLTEEVKQHLQQEYREDILKVQELIQQDLSQWL